MCSESGEPVAATGVGHDAAPVLDKDEVVDEIVITLGGVEEDEGSIMC